MRRRGSINRQFAKRIPVDVRARAIGRKLTIPLADTGEAPVTVTVTKRMGVIRFSLRTADPSEAKIRNARAAAYLESVWNGLRRPVAALSHRQATALPANSIRLGRSRRARARRPSWRAEQAVR